MSKLLNFISFMGFAAIGLAQQMQLPATFRGTVPCADCSGIQTTLTLRDDKLFFLRQVYQGKKTQPSWRMGEWEFSGQKLTLKTGDERMYFSMQDSRTLRQLDTQGNPIESAANYNLKRSSSVITPASMLLTGMFTYMADAASLKECNTGRNFGVQGGPGYLALERMYTQNRTEPGKPLFVSFYGRLVPSKMEEGPREAISVDRALPYQAGRSCAGQVAAVTPADFSGKWTLSEIDGAAPAGEAWIEIDTAARRISGNNGCNRMTGGYESSGNGIRFQNFAGTRMACPGGAMALESSVNKALANAEARLTGNTLEVLQNGAVVAKFRKNAPGSASAFDGKWVLAELHGRPPVATGAYLQIESAEGRLSGSSGCNRMMGGFTVSGSGLKIGNLAGTMMACPGAKSELERELLSVLNGSELLLSGRTLEVVKGGSALATFQREGGGVSTRGKWTLQELNGAAYSGGEVFFELDPEQKRVAGKSGCNRMTGTYEEAAGKFTFGRMAGTRMACPGDAMATEAAVLKAFGGVGRISGDTFELLLNGDVVARFGRQ